jgi:1-phosphofructokinase family hexose kinase
MILCLGTTPAAQRVMLFKTLTLDAVNRAATTLDGVAGKSINVAKVLKTLGADPLAAGFLGGPRGDEIRQALAARQIATDFLTVPAPTRQCITVLDQASGEVTELVEESAPVPAASFDDLLNLVRRRVRGCRALVLSGTIATGGPVVFYRECVRLARDAGAWSVVDAQGAALMETLPASPSLVKPNRHELAQTLGHEISTEEDLLTAIRLLHERGAQRVVVTAGRDGALASDGARAWRISAPRISALNSIGSGDSFTAAMVWRLLAGDDLGEACRWGAAAGAANALTLMPGDLDPAQLHHLASHVRLDPLESGSKPR